MCEGVCKWYILWQWLMFYRNIPFHVIPSSGLTSFRTLPILLFFCSPFLMWFCIWLDIFPTSYGCCFLSSFQNGHNANLSSPFCHRPTDQPTSTVPPCYSAQMIKQINSILFIQWFKEVNNDWSNHQPRASQVHAIRSNSIDVSPSYTYIFKNIMKIR